MNCSRLRCCVILGSLIRHQAAAMELQSTHCSQSKRGNSRRLNDTEKGTYPFSSHVDFELKK